MKYTLKRADTRTLAIWDDKEAILCGLVQQARITGLWAFTPFPADRRIFNPPNPSLAGLLIDAGFEGYVEVEE